MPQVLAPIIVVLVAAVATMAVVPAFSRLPIHRKLLDYPDGDRHHHARPIPRLGGVAIFFGLLIAVSLGSIVSPSLTGATPWALPLNRALAVASGMLFLIGLLDDLRGVGPAIKLLGQTLAAGLVVQFGFAIEQVSFVPGYSFSLGVLSLPITIFWLVGVSNAYNLVDGLDGLAGGVGVIATAAIVASGFVIGGKYSPFQALALGGALLGFLKYNWPQARVFLGDSGSLVVGFLLAVLSVKAATTPDGIVYALVPIFALSYLLLDTGIAIMRRWLRGTPLSRADGRHIHHQLLALGLSPRRALAVIYVQSAFVALLGLCVTFVAPQMMFVVIAAAIALLVLILVYGLRWLEYHEFLEAGASFASGVRKARTAIRDRIVARDVARLLIEATTLEEVNSLLARHAPSFRFLHAEVRCSHTDASWSGATAGLEPAAWRMEYPIYAESVVASPSRSFSHVLSIWCPLASGGRPVNVERVARILAPALEISLSSDQDRAIARPRPMALRNRFRSGVDLHARRIESEGAVGAKERART